MDMGPMGVYQIFAMGDAPAGGMMTKMPQTPAPFWLLLFQRRCRRCRDGTAAKSFTAPCRFPAAAGSPIASTRKASSLR
jgi:hypothetical protein